VEPSVGASAKPSAEPSVGPIREPSGETSVEPSVGASVEPSVGPIREPSVETSAEPSSCTNTASNLKIMKKIYNRDESNSMNVFKKFENRIRLELRFSENIWFNAMRSPKCKVDDSLEFRIWGEIKFSTQTLVDDIVLSSRTR